MSFSSKLVLSDWHCRTPITDVSNLEESKFDYKRNLLCKKKALRDIQIRSMHEMEEMKRAQCQEMESNHSGRLCCVPSQTEVIPSPRAKLRQTLAT